MSLEWGAMGAAGLAGVVLAGWYYILHFSGRAVQKPEFYARPLYYAVGFGSYLVVSGLWAGLISLFVPTLPPWGTWFCCVIIGVIGGLGMCAAYFKNLQDDAAAIAQNAAAAKGTIDD